MASGVGWVVLQPQVLHHKTCIKERIRSPLTASRCESVERMIAKGQTPRPLTWKPSWLASCHQQSVNRKRLSTHGRSSLSKASELLLISRRYIEQYQALLTSSTSVAEKDDLELYKANIRAATNGGEEDDSEMNDESGDTTAYKVYAGYIDNVWDIVGEQPPSGIKKADYTPLPLSDSAALVTSSSTMDVSGWAAQMMGLPPAKFNYERWVSGAGTIRRTTGDISFIS